jgi:MbtH protein
VATNPFEDPDASYLVLVNEEGQYSLWPVFADVPDGWEVTFGEAGRQECLDYIEENWTDMRPKSLIRAMEEDARQRNGAGYANGAVESDDANGNGTGEKKRRASKGRSAKSEIVSASNGESAD